MSYTRIQSMRELQPDVLSAGTLKPTD